MKDKKLICIIPARSGSKGIKDKNILLLDDVPLVAYPILAAKQCELISEVYVSTDSSKIAEIAIEFGAEVIQRPAELAQDDSLDIDVFRHAVRFLESYSDIVHLRATTPLIKPEMIEKGIKYFYNNPDCTSMRSMQPAEQPVEKHFTISGKYAFGCFPHLNDEYYIKPRQLLSKSYIGSDYIDIVRPQQFMNSNSLLGNRILAFITPRMTIVDTMEDFEYLKNQIKQKS